jgi:hypothetical protein
MARRNDDARFAGRDGEIWRAYTRGETQESIGKRFGITQTRVSQIIVQVRASIPEPDRVALILRETEFLDQMRLTALALVDSRPIPAYSNGKPIIMDDGTPAEDHSGRLAAYDRALKAHERYCRLLGLDAPTRSDVAATVAATGDDIEIVRRIREWRGEGEPQGPPAD